MTLWIGNVTTGATSGATATATAAAMSTTSAGLAAVTGDRGDTPLTGDLDRERFKWGRRFLGLRDRLAGDLDRLRSVRRLTGLRRRRSSQPRAPRSLVRSRDRERRGLSRERERERDFGLKDFLFVLSVVVVVATVGVVFFLVSRASVTLLASVVFSPSIATAMAPPLTVGTSSTIAGPSGFDCK